MAIRRRPAGRPGSAGFVRGPVRPDEEVLARWTMPRWYLLPLGVVGSVGIVLYGLQRGGSLTGAVVGYVLAMLIVAATVAPTLLVLTPDHLVVRTFRSERLPRAELESVSLGPEGIDLRSRGGQLRPSYVVLLKFPLPAVHNRAHRIVGEIREWAGLPASGAPRRRRRVRRPSS